MENIESNVHARKESLLTGSIHERKGMDQEGERVCVQSRLKNSGESLGKGNYRERKYEKKSFVRERGKKIPDWD